jgi:hypothetical protein
VEDVASRAEDLPVWAYPPVVAQRLRLDLTSPRDPDSRRPPTPAGAPGRHARSDRNRGLVRGPGGALRIDLAATEPAAGTGNWLPPPVVRAVRR